MSAEYIMASGNENVILCERGVRTFETYTRNTLDLSAIPAIRQMSHLPIIVDPSHAAGMYWMVEPLALAATAIGADGLIVEVHNDPATPSATDSSPSPPRSSTPSCRRWRACAPGVRARTERGAAMKTLRVDLPGRAYDIHIERGALDRVGELCPRRAPPVYPPLCGDRLQCGSPSTWDEW